MEMHDKLAIIADDYTGAGDSGIHFPRAGKRIDLLLSGPGFAEQLSMRDGVTLSTESRFLAPEDAASSVAAIIAECRRAGFNRFYKKIDSTLRGNPGSEIESALNATDREAALVCTGMPRTGRTCVNGEIFLNKTPLHLTEIGGDPFNPISTSSVAALLGQQTSLPVGMLTIKDIEADRDVLTERITALVGNGIKLIVADAETDEHLSALAKQIGRGASLLPVGAGGFARALADFWHFKQQPAADNDENPVQGPMLAVVGSLTETSRQQAEYACRCGAFRLFDIHPRYSWEDIERELAGIIADEGSKSANILLQFSGKTPPARTSKKEGERVAKLLGNAAALVCRSYGCKTVFSTGGSTSMGVARALGIRGVTLVDEIMPGVVLGTCSAESTGVRWFVSKAGGFGEKEILVNIAACLVDSKKGVKK